MLEQQTEHPVPATDSRVLVLTLAPKSRRKAEAEWRVCFVDHGDAISIFGNGVCGIGVKEPQHGGAVAKLFVASYGEMHSEAVSEELLRTVSATLPFGELNVLQSPGAKGMGGAGAKKLIW